jgi:hypothetical protein
MSAIATFRAATSGCFVLPNPWDVGSARTCSTSVQGARHDVRGVAFSRGAPDTVSSVPRDVMLAHIRDVVSATTLPVNADFLAGYADDPEGVAANVTLAVGTGAAGISIEDGTGNDAAPLYEAPWRSSASGPPAVRSTPRALPSSSRGDARPGSSACRTRSAWREGGSPRTPKRAPIVFTPPASPSPVRSPRS